ncbi:MAG: hypothetical protein A3E36_03570 [Candidatus Andersenbacteria bacterium RIFCSPHIGHO2_12_FULL_45_11b]|uniref:Uncharacterized protein n=1 Tax=Candidatus Andersenbacteria bacterium RIFCSPHIGHO2_12_FULL_45_11b TaxID=1797282 RepID=A0A1G1X7B6_9BACT|nr:MAG: hypothetical protein A3E36_03570 [Candidatus Andersenbacteria bacterium RIFCSPHIGHO2_12_FULL_45_11b]
METLLDCVMLGGSLDSVAAWEEAVRELAAQFQYLNYPYKVDLEMAKKFIDRVLALDKARTNLQDIADSLGVDYEKVLEWEDMNDSFTEICAVAHEVCLGHGLPSFETMLFGDLPDEDDWIPEGQ